MKKHVARLLAVMALVILAGVLYAAPAQAAEKLVSMKPGQTVKPPSDYYYLYKLTVAKDGILEVTNKSDWGFYLYTKYKKSGDYYYTDGTSVSYSYSNAGKTNYIAIKKGTYYFEAKGGSVKTKYIKPGYKPNYTRKKAIALKKNKQVIACQLDDMNYNRWYKISLKKKTSVTLISNNRGYIDLYNSKGIKVETLSDSDNNTMLYSKPLPKGTYYIRIGYIDTYPTSDYTICWEAITLKWK